MEKPQTKRQEYQILKGQLENERSSFLSHWRDLGDFILPRRPRFNVQDVNKGDRRNQKIIDSTATMAARTLRSGMMSGVTSPARPWFRLSTPDPGLAEFGPVKQWLDIVSTRMSGIFLRSNLYNVLPIIYGDMGTFATGAMSVEEDFDDVLRCYPFPIGSYMIANNDKLKVDVFFRDFRMTVRQLVQRYGKIDSTGKPDWTNISTYVRNLWDQSLYETWIDICHVIRPNPDFNPNKLDSKYKKYISCTYEPGTSSAQKSNYMNQEDDKYLKESGYDYFPILCPRWEVTGEDVYGTDCPGMSALGDIKALQVMQKRKAQAVEKMVNPPMVGPSSLKMVKTTILPGDITYSDERDGQKGFRPAHEVNPRIQELLMDVESHQGRIKRAYYEDLFLQLHSDDRRQRATAEEIIETKSEAMIVLGPVLEQLNQDMLDPLIDIAFDLMLRQNKEKGLIPPPPKELSGVKLKVDYISIMAQAQKLVGVSGLQRFFAFAQQIVAVDPQAMDKVNSDQGLDEFADMTSIPAGVVRSDEETAGIRQGRQQAVAAQQKSEALRNATGAAKDLSQTDLGSDNALSRLVDGGNGQVQ